MDYKTMMGYSDTKKKKSKPKENKVLNSIKEEFGHTNTLKEVGAAPQYKQLIKKEIKLEEKL